jgi:hypothetical protein
MGAWGHGIRQDDVVCDVIGVFEDNLKQGKSIVDATKAVRKQFAEAVKDSDDGPLFWIAIADAQWTYGQLDAGILQHVKDDFESGRSLSRWDENDTLLSRRKDVLKKFIDKIEKPNPRPKKPPRTTVRTPKFKPGDCLSILLSNGQFGAGIVLAVDHSNSEYGLDMVCALDYMSPEKPSREAFLERKWLYRTHHNWNNEIDVAWYMHVGFRKMKPRLEVICSIDLLASDPESRKEGIAYAGWEHLGEQIILQREWDSKKGKSPSPNCPSSS